MPSRNVQIKVGIFTAVALGLFVLAAALLASGVFVKEEEDYVLYFAGSVSGLSVGAPVVFRGVPLGRVASISMVANMRDETVTIPVGIEIFERNILSRRHSGTVTDTVRAEMIKRMVQHGLRARISITSLLTGQARIELDFFPETPAHFQSEEPEREIPTLSSPLEEFSRALAKINIDEIAGNLLIALQGFNSLILSDDLKGSLSAFKLAIEDAARLMAGMPALREMIDGMLRRFDKDTQNALQEIPKLGKEVRAALTDFRRAADRVEKGFAASSRVLAPDAATVKDLQETLKELAEAARAVRALARNLERNPESLLRGKGGGRP